MQDKLNIAVFVDYDNIEIGLKSTLRREFDVSLALDALKPIAPNRSTTRFGGRDCRGRPND